MNVEHLTHFKLEMEKNAGIWRKILTGKTTKVERVAAARPRAEAAVKKEIMSLPVQDRVGFPIPKNRDLKDAYKHRKLRQSAGNFVGSKPIKDEIYKRELQKTRQFRSEARNPFHDQKTHFGSAVKNLPASGAVIGGLALAGTAYGGIKYRDSFSGNNNAGFNSRY